MRPFPVKAPMVEIFHMAPREFLDAGTWMSEALADALGIEHDTLCSDVIPAMRHTSWTTRTDRPMTRTPRRIPSSAGVTVAQVESACRDLSGYYFWCCAPGCLPDGDPTGPEKSIRAATRAARALYLDF